MQTCHTVDLPTLEQLIIPSPLTVKNNALVIDVINLMSQGRGSELSLSDEDSRSELNLPSQKQSSCALVVEDTKVVGIFTERDVVRAIASRVDLSKTEIAQVMTQPVITLALSATENAQTALSLMRQHRMRHLPVVDEQGKLVGLVTQDRLYQEIAPAQMLTLTQQVETAQLKAKPKRPKGKRKTVEIALGESEERYRLMFESNPNPMWFYDPETLAFLEVNQAAIAHYGYSKDEFLQMTIADIRPPSDLPALRQVSERLLPGQPYIGIWQHYKKDGSIIDVEVNAHAFPVAGRQANLVLIQDITELRRLEANRQQAEAALRESEAKYRTLFNSIDEGLIVCDVIFAQNDHPVDIFYVEANAAAVRLVGQELVGRRTSDLSPDFEAEWFEILGRVARTGEAVRMELPAAPLNAWYDHHQRSW